ncbi:GNAT family N-acetyltransferase [Maribacter sp.]|uniref:GNAT family N-acetyltransferase n=1 Tax=Maribacter sp. TaxID=1897614 RepID=UPI003C783EF2
MAKKSIIYRDGHLFFALHDVQIAGCFAFIPFNRNIYELIKMAVDLKYKGQQIGQQL